MNKLKTVEELKKICRKKKLKGYSKLNKKELLLFLEKSNKKKVKIQKGGMVMINDDNIHEAVNEWCKNPENAKIKYGPINEWNTSNVTNMKNLFKNKLKFNGDISNWDVSKVTNMDRMFDRATSFNKNISKWNVEKVTNMDHMFERASSFNGNIREWNVEKVTNMKNMFSKASTFNGDISIWNVSNVENMTGMLEGARLFNGNISEWNVSKVKNMNFMFEAASSFNGNISEWNVEKVTCMSNMFCKASTFNGDISIWNVSNVENMGSMFQMASSFNQDLSNWDVSNVEYMAYMFNRASTFNGDISEWNVEKVTSMSNMFQNASTFNGDISRWNVSNVENMNQMFEGDSSFDRDIISEWNISPSINRNEMFNYIYRNSYIFRQNIVIPKNMIPENNKNRNTCSNKLYTFILGTDDNILINNRFKFEGQTGIDHGGLSRTVFDLFYKMYFEKFFKMDAENKFAILKKYNNTTIIDTSTNKLKILAKKAKVKICIPVQGLLLELLLKNNLNNNSIVNNNNKIKYHVIEKYPNKNYNMTIQNNLNIIGINLFDVMVVNNANTNSENKTPKYTLNNLRNTTKKKDIYVRIYLKSCGFTDYNNFLQMKIWMKNNWTDELFTNKLSFSKVDFMKRIKIIKPGKLLNTAINVPTNINSNNFIKEHPNLKLLLQYIKQDDDKYRIKFNKWLTGSVYSNAILKLFVHDSINDTPYAVSTCYNYMNIYKTTNNINRNVLLSQFNSNITTSSISN